MLNVGCSGAVPVPVRGTLSGLVDAFVVKVRFAVSEAAAVGEKTTPTLQEALTASEALQVLELVEN